MRGYKLIPGNWRCRRKQYAVGKTAVTRGEPKLCMRGMHFCRDMKDCLTYYDLTPDMHMCEVEAEGDIDGPEEDGDSKCCTNKLRIVREIPFEELMERIMECGLLKINGFLLQFVKDQTPEICLAAVKQNGWALEYVKEQTPEICLAAVQENGWALEYVREQTPEICMAAVQQDGRALRFVKDQTFEICLAAVQQDGWALLYVDGQTIEVCLAAVRQDSAAINFVRNEDTRQLCRETLGLA